MNMNIKINTKIIMIIIIIKVVLFDLGCGGVPDAPGVGEELGL